MTPAQTVEAEEASEAGEGDHVEPEAVEEDVEDTVEV